jgi:hypothetical protein
MGSDGSSNCQDISHDSIVDISYNDHHGLGDDLAWDASNNPRLQSAGIDVDKVRANDGSGLKLYDDGNSGLFVEDGGDVGIGTTTPGAALDVTGEISTDSDLTVTGSASVGGFDGCSSNQFINGDGQCENDDAGSDDQNLQSTSRTGTTVTIPIENGASTSFTDERGMTSWTLEGDTGSTIINNGDTASVTGGTAISTSESGGDVTINNGYGSSINVGEAAFTDQGLSTTANVNFNRIDASGDIEVGGDVVSKNADIAEWMPAERSLKPGDVVRINEEGVLERTDEEAEESHGVITTDPAMVLGESGEERARLALTGTVPVKATSSQGKIRPGDDVAPSNVSGHVAKARKGAPRLGIALEALNAKNGRIRILLSKRSATSEADEIEEMRSRLNRLEEQNKKLAALVERQEKRVNQTSTER